VRHKLFRKLTYSVEQCPSRRANRLSASQEISRISWDPELHYRVHNSPPPVHIISQINPIHSPPIPLLEDPSTYPTHVILLDLITRKNEKGGAYGTFGDRRDAYRVLVARTDERDQLEYLGIDGRIILKWDLQEVGRRGRDWIALFQDRHR